jgi:hypothetical protein
MEAFPIPGHQLKIKSKKVAYFSWRKTQTSAVHVYHAFHHNFTTKNHPAAPGKSQKPLQKGSFLHAAPCHKKVRKKN